MFCALVVEFRGTTWSRQGANPAVLPPVIHNLEKSAFIESNLQRGRSPWSFLAMFPFQTSITVVDNRSILRVFTLEHFQVRRELTTEGVSVSQFRQKLPGNLDKYKLHSQDTNGQRLPLHFDLISHYF